MLRLDPTHSEKTVEHKGLLKHWECLGMPTLLFAGLYIDGACSDTNNAILKPEGHVETGAGNASNVYARVQSSCIDVCLNVIPNSCTGLQACKLVPVIGNESVIVPWVGGFRDR